jgi:hypothetical protein
MKAVFVSLHHPGGRFTIGDTTIKFTKQGFRGVFETTDPKLTKKILASQYIDSEIKLEKMIPIGDEKPKQITKARFQCLPEALDENEEIPVKKFGKIKFDQGFFETDNPDLIKAIQKLPNFGKELGTLSDPDDSDSMVMVAMISFEQS